MHNDLRTNLTEFGQHYTRVINLGANGIDAIANMKSPVINGMRHSFPPKGRLATKLIGW